MGPALEGETWDPGRHKGGIHYLAVWHWVFQGVNPIEHNGTSFCIDMCRIGHLWLRLALLTVVFAKKSQDFYSNGLEILVIVLIECNGHFFPSLKTNNEKF